MSLPLLPLLTFASLSAGLSLAALGGDTNPQVYQGREHQTAVAPPRIDASVNVDGRLDEPAWKQAALLTGFSQYVPVDGRPAADSTEVLVWYSPTAIHFGIRAFEAHGGAGAVRATLADRDRIDADDWVEIDLGTFGDRRQVSVFAVNPLGVQTDGTMLAGAKQTGGFGAQDSRERPDLSADFVYQSKGRVTPDGFEVEVRIPFKSLRYQAADVQAWTLNVVRRVQHSGYEDSWFRAARSAASFVAQAGTLEGLHGLERGLVLDLTPEATGRASGTPGSAGWGYDDRRDLGLTARWGVTNNLTVNATANPDFSQVESDAGQFQFDPRQRIIYAEKRPFFLDGIEQFASPFTLIHTRTIVQPRGAVKFTGKAAGTNVAVLAAVDDREASAYAPLSDGDPTRRAPLPLFAVARLTRDLGGQSRAGLTFTQKDDGSRYNTVGAADARLVFGKIYSVVGALGGSVSDYDDGRGPIRAPVWAAQAFRDGRRFGARYSLSGIAEDFDAQAGAVSRGGIVNLDVDHRVSFFGRPGALVESYAVDLELPFVWKYRRFVDGGDAIEKKYHLNNNLTLRGGWNVGASALVERFGYDEDIYSNYRVVRPASGGAVGAIDTTSYSGGWLPNLDWLVQAGTPQWSKFSGSLFYLWGRDENFYEWSNGAIQWLTLNANYRPTDKVRAGLSWQRQQVRRYDDRSLVERWSAPRLKVEYQLARPLFVRVVTEYATEMRDSLRDASRTNAPVYFTNADGTLTRALGWRDENLRGDWLISYTPVPGTVFYAGYGSTRHARTLDMYRRPDDLPVSLNGFFVKASYLFRM